MKQCHKYVWNISIHKSGIDIFKYNSSLLKLQIEITIIDIVLLRSGVGDSELEGNLFTSDKRLFNIRNEAYLI